MTTAVNDAIDVYLAVGGETQFSYTFPIIIVIAPALHPISVETRLAGVLTTLTEGVDFTVTGAGEPLGGTILLDTGVFPAGAIAGVTWTIERANPVNRVTDFQISGDFFAAEVNDQLDYITEIIQDQVRDIDANFANSMHLEVGSLFTLGEMEDPIASTFLRAKAGGGFDWVSVAVTGTATSVDETDTDATKDKLCSNLLLNTYEDVVGKQADLASAATVSIGAAQGFQVDITGVVTITSFGTADRLGIRRLVQFDGALTLTHGIDLNLPGDADILTAAGDTLLVYAETTTKWFVIQYFKADGEALVDRKGTDIASAATTDISGLDSFVDVTGVVTITALGTAPAGIHRTVQFDGILILTHNATSLILPGNANITTAAGDVAEFVSLGSGNWLCKNYQRDVQTPDAGSMVLLATATASASATIDFDSGIDFAAYKKYVLEFSDLVAASDDVDLMIRTSTDGGTGYDAGGTDYTYTFERLIDSSTVAVVRSGAATSVPISTNPTSEGWGNTAGESVAGSITLWNPSGTRNTMMDFVVTGQTATSGDLCICSGSGMREAAEDVDGIRIVMESGNITSGVFKLYGVI